MSDEIQALQERLQERWQAALAQENTSQVEELVRLVLRQYPNTALASEIRYKRGVLILTEGEGIGSERMAKALHEFREGLKAGEEVGPTAEPWRSLNRTQLAVCLAKRNNIQGAVQELLAVANYHPPTVTGLGALTLLQQILEANQQEREAKRYKTQRLSYTRSLVQENEHSPEIHTLRFLLAQELLDSVYADEGEEILQSLLNLDQNTLGTELYEDIREYQASRTA